jgi:CheY-like chemotaxis protein
VGEVEKKSIMVVEDEGIVSIDIQNILLHLGYSISAVAFTGIEAISNLEKTQADLILMDIGLKGTITGIEAAKNIKSQYNIPIIFLTGYADENTLRKAKEVNPSGYIIKPIDENELKAAIEKALTS